MDSFPESKNEALVKRATTTSNLFFSIAATTHIQTCVQTDLLQDRFGVSGKTCNIAIQLFLRQCCKTSWMFFVALREHPILPRPFPASPSYLARCPSLINHGVQTKMAVENVFLIQRCIRAFLRRIKILL